MPGVESADDLAAFFSTDEFAEAATYTPPGGGAPVAVSAIVDRKTRDVEFGGGSFTAPSVTALVRAAELANPQSGGTLVLGAVTYKIGRAPAQDATGLVWSLALEKQS